MHAASQQGFVLSLGLHASVAALFAAVAIWPQLQRNKPTVFEVVQIPLGSPDVKEATAPANTESSFDLPEPPAAAPTPRPPQNRPPTPTPPAARPPQNTVAPPRPTTAPATNPTTPPATKPPERISYDQFVDQHGKPKPQVRNPRTTTSPRTNSTRAPRIDTRFPVTVGDAVRNPGSLTGVADAERSVLSLYIASLKDAVEAKWERPPFELAVLVHFDVAANGRISSVRIARSSGNGAFDESVLAAFRAVGSVGPTPGGRALQLKLEFSMVPE